MTLIFVLALTNTCAILSELISITLADTRAAELEAAQHHQLIITIKMEHLSALVQHHLTVDLFLSESNLLLASSLDCGSLPFRIQPLNLLPCCFTLSGCIIPSKISLALFVLCFNMEHCGRAAMFSDYQRTFKDSSFRALIFHRHKYMSMNCLTILGQNLNTYNF